MEWRQVSEEVARYPLATQTGIAMLQHLIIGDRVWSGCTKPQMRMALERRGLVADGRITGKAVYAWYWAVGFKQVRS